ncbi:MAG TPA: hypothetical protein VLD58_09305, partial [Gemmatimonadales bacterium]|nr:hypothetical protein [Gemmatimonadales bacterium]
MTGADLLDIGREAFDRKAWAEAYANLWAADRDEPLGPEDLERLAITARLRGRDAESGDLWARAYQAHDRRGDPGRAARCAFWLAIELLLEGETARSGGWVSRARRLLGEGDCVEQGYLLVP